MGEESPGEKKTLKRRRNVGLDLAKVLASVGVVVIHFIGQETGPVNAMVYTLAAFAIPTFVICNGYFVLNRRELTWTYATGKCLGLLSFIFVWCCVNWAFFAVGRRELGTWGLLTPIHDFLACGIQRGDDQILWFLWMLAGLELVSPAMLAVQRKVGWVTLLAVLGGICLFVDIASVLGEASGGLDVQGVVPQPLRLWTWAFYFALGGAFGDYRSLGRLHAKGFALPSMLIVLGAGGCSPGAMVSGGASGDCTTAVTSMSTQQQSRWHSVLSSCATSLARASSRMEGLRVSLLGSRRRVSAFTCCRFLYARFSATFMTWVTPWRTWCLFRLCGSCFWDSHSFLTASPGFAAS